jgi:hypothetical protein
MSDNNNNYPAPGGLKCWQRVVVYQVASMSFQDESLTMSEAAKTLGVSNHAIRRVIKDGILAAVAANAPAVLSGTTITVIWHRFVSAEMRRARCAAQLALRPHPGGDPGVLQRILHGRANPWPSGGTS